MNRFTLCLAAAALIVPAMAEQVSIVRLPDRDTDDVRWQQQNLGDVYTSDVRLRLVVTPSFAPVWAVALKRVGNGWRLTYTNPLMNLPESGSDKPPVNELRCDAPIDTVLAERLTHVWDSMLTNYIPRQPDDYGQGGVTYSFAARNHNAEKRADLHSPKNNTPPAIFAALGSDLAAYCTTARHWFWAPATWWNGRLIGEKLDKLDVTLKGTKPAKLEENPNDGFWMFPTEDHLTPMTPPKLAAKHGDKDALVEQVLYREAFGPTVRARVRIDIQPGLNEVMAFVTEDHGRYQLVSLRAEIPIGLIAFRIVRRGAPPEPPIDPHKVKVVRQTLNLPPALARELIADWKDALVWAVPSARGHYGFDGISYYFSMEDKSGAYAGRTRSSDGLPVVDALEAVANNMVVECEYGTNSLEKCDLLYVGDLQQSVGTLTKALKAKRQ